MYKATKLAANITSLQMDHVGSIKTRSTAPNRPRLIVFRGKGLDKSALHMFGEDSSGNPQKLPSWPHVPRESLMEPRELEQRIIHIAWIYKGLSCRSLTELAKDSFLHPLLNLKSSSSLAFRDSLRSSSSCSRPICPEDMQTRQCARRLHRRSTIGECISQQW